MQSIILTPLLARKHSSGGGGSTSRNDIGATCRAFDAHSFLEVHARTTLVVKSLQTAALLPYRPHLQSITWARVQPALLWTMLVSYPMPQLLSLTLNIERNLAASDIAAALEHQTQLTALDLAFGDKAACDLLPAAQQPLSQLPALPNLRSLSLDQVFLDGVNDTVLRLGLRYLTAMQQLTRLAVLLRVDDSRRPFHTEYHHMRPVTNALSCLPELRELCLSHWSCQQMPDVLPCWEQLSQQLPLLIHLTMLKLDAVDIAMGTLAASCLSELSFGLSHLVSLRYLELHADSVSMMETAGDDHTESETLARAMGALTGLEYLSLSEMDRAVRDSDLRLHLTSLSHLKVFELVCRPTPEDAEELGDDDGGAGFVTLLSNMVQLERLEVTATFSPPAVHRLLTQGVLALPALQVLNIWSDEDTEQCQAGFVQLAASVGEGRLPLLRQVSTRNLSSAAMVDLNHSVGRQLFYRCG